MEIILNHQAGLAETEPGSTIGRVLADLKDFLSRERMVLLELTLDGNVLDPVKEHEQEWRDRPAAEFSRLEIKAAPIKEIALAILTELNKQLPALQEHAVQSARGFSSAELGAGYEELQRMISELASLQCGLDSVGKAVPGIFEGAPTSWITRLRDLLSQLKHRLDEKDLVSVADILEFELPPLLEEGKPLLSRLNIR